MVKELKIKYGKNQIIVYLDNPCRVESITFKSINKSNERDVLDESIIVNIGDNFFSLRKNGDEKLFIIDNQTNEVIKEFDLNTYQSLVEQVNITKQDF